MRFWTENSELWAYYGHNQKHYDHNMPIMPIQNILDIKKQAEQNIDTVINGFASITHHEDYFSATIPKVVVNESNQLMYMSRAPIPGNKAGKFESAYKQICVYSFPKKALENYGLKSSKSKNENIEDIEIMRLLDRGFTVKMLEMSSNTIAVDTLEDLERVRLIIQMQGEDLSEYDCE